MHSVIIIKSPARCNDSAWNFVFRFIACLNSQWDSVWFLTLTILALSIPDSCQRACTWFFECHAKFLDGRNFSDVLAAREQIRRRNWLQLLKPVISLALCGDPPILGLGVQIKRFFYSLQHIRLNSLKQWLPGGQMAFAQVDGVAFEHVPLDSNNFYKRHPKIRTFLHQTTPRWIPPSKIQHFAWITMHHHQSLLWFDRGRNQMAAACASGKDGPAPHRSRGLLCSALCQISALSDQPASRCCPRRCRPLRLTTNACFVFIGVQRVTCDQI